MQVEKAKLMAGSVRKLLRRSAHGHVVNLLVKLRPAEVSHILQELTPREQSSVFALLVKHDRKTAALALIEFGPERGTSLLEGLESREVARLLQELPTDDRALLVGYLPEELAEEVLELMRVEASVEVRGLLQYEEDTAGRIMTPGVFALDENVSVAEAIQAIQTGQDLEMIFYVYVVDDRNHLVGVVSLRQLLTVPPSTPLRKVMTTDCIAVHTDTDQEEVARLVAAYDILAIPVVDQENKLLGVVTVDDVIDVIREEATEDILHLVGVEADDHVHSTAPASIRKRLPWLAVYLCMALLGVTVVSFYEPTIAAVPLLAVFMPVVAGMGGTSGTQTLTLTVRSLALGEINWANARSVALKEVLVGLGNGICVGTLAGVLAFFWKGNPMLGVILGAAMISNMFLAGILGSVIPLIFKKLNIDPAIVSSIFLTTLTDMAGFACFLGLATVFL